MDYGAIQTKGSMMNHFPSISKLDNPAAHKKMAGIALLVVVGFILIHFWDDIQQLISFLSNREEVVAFESKLGIWGPLFIGGSIVLQILVAVIPGHPLMFASGLLYGLLNGFILSWVFVVIATQTAFLIARRGGRPIVNRLVGTEQASKWERFSRLDNIGFYILTFNLPMFPSDVMGYVAGLSQISPKRFLIANIVGRAPVPFLLAFFGSFGGLSFDIPPSLLGVTAVVLLGAVILIKRAIIRHHVDVLGVFSV